MKIPKVPQYWNVHLSPLELNGIFENQPGYPLLVKHRDVSALLVAKRNEQAIENGYKPIFGLIQNPYALNPIAQDEFENIQKYVIFSETESNFEMKWIWE